MIFGAAEPGGRLPTTGRRRRTGHPSVTPVDGVLAYDEGLAIGYRGPVEPLLPFGHGLGYTSWEYLAMDGARVRLANTGTRRGREVVQVYASRPDSAIERPARWLAGFAVVEADAGEEVIVDVPLAPRAFQHWDGGWQTRAAASSRSKAGPRSRRRPAAGARAPRGAEPARVLRGGRAPPALHARGRGALRHPAGAVAADPPARGGARARAAAADLARASS